MQSSRQGIQNGLVFACCILLIAGCIVFQIPFYFGFFGGVALSFMMLLKRGFAAKSMFMMMLEGIRGCTIVFIIIILIGTNISVWLASGIVPTLIFYGFEYIKDINFVFACFAVTSVISVVMGTAVGTISTIGLALLGIGKGLGIPSPVLLGAIVSGAFIADRLSPVSGLVNLTCRTTRVDYRQYVRSLSKTLIPTVVLTAGIFYYIGTKGTTVVEPAKLQFFQHSLQQSFSISPYLLLLPLTVIVMAVLGVKPIINMSVGVSGGILLGVLYQQNSFIKMLKHVWFGYRYSGGLLELDSILKGGGIQPMIEVLLIVMGAVALSSLLEGTDLINPVIEQFVSKARTGFSLLLRTALLSVFLTVVTCDQTAGIILLGKLMQEKFEAFNLGRERLARTIADTGTTVAPLIPWNVNAIIILAITGMTSLQYAPYAILCLVGPLITLGMEYITAIRAGLSGKS